MPKALSIEDLIQKTAAANAAKNDDASASKPAATTTAKPTKRRGKDDEPKEAYVPEEDRPAPQRLQAHMTRVQLREKEMLTQAEADKLGIPYISLEEFPIAPEALSLIPQEKANELGAIPFFSGNGDIRLGILKPTPEIDAYITELENEQHADVKTYLISEHSFQAANALYKILPEIKEVSYGYRIEEADLAKYKAQINDVRELQTIISKVSVTDVTTLVLGAALNSDASDVHIEAEEDVIRVRFRLDGELRDVATLPADAWKQVIARLKLLSHVKMNVEGVPQDGRITIYLANEKIDIRVSFLPTAFGESVVMRILRPKAVALEFENLGIRGRALERLEREIERPNGMIVTTGPTGSGKTTTLYAILKKLNRPEVKIITLEDPIEYKLQGINQSQIDHGKQYDFAKGLRSILRQDPDIVMVGEIRDLETADIAIQAALTGHLVVSTIHTNSASGAIPRFLSMGVKPFLLAPAVNAIIGQRLVRRLCTQCRVPAKLSRSHAQQVQAILHAIPAAANVHVDFTKLDFFDAGKGCDACNGSGYKGRVGIYEIFTMTPELEEAVLSTTIPEATVEKMAEEDGMITMAQDGLLKALDGLTSVQEVLRVANTTSTLFEPEPEENADEEKEAPAEASEKSA